MNIFEAIFSKKKSQVIHPIYVHSAQELSMFISGFENLIKRSVYMYSFIFLGIFATLSKRETKTSLLEVIYI